MSRRTAGRCRTTSPGASSRDVNLLRYIEELTRMPLRRRRRPAPGTVEVYLSRHGRLYCPPGGLTSGELWWRAPCRVYEVDVASHPLALTVELAGAGDHRTTV